MGASTQDMKNAHARLYYHTNKDALAKRREVSRNKSPTRSRFIAKKSQAKARGIEFSLIESAIIWPTHCPVLGIELSYAYGNKNVGPRDNSPSFDRLDPTKGYNPENTIIVSYRANRIKNDATPEELEKVCAFYKAPR